MGEWKEELTSKMNNDIRSRWNGAIVVTSHIEMGSQGIEYLARVGEVCFHGVDIY